MGNDLFSIKKSILIIEDEYEDTKEVTIAIDLKEMLEENDIVSISLQIDNEEFKKIILKRSV